MQPSRRALGSRRSVDKMRVLEAKLRAGMDANGGRPGGAGGDHPAHQLVRALRLSGEPAASFALLAYASAWLKFHYLAAFACAILNNQPMGFYSAAVVLKDAQQHGLRVKPVDVLHSLWSCTLETEPDGSHALRLGFCYVRGLGQPSRGSW